MIRTSPRSDGLVGGHAVHPGVVVDVAVGVDHRTDRPFTQGRVGEVETRRSRRLGGQRVDDQPARVGGHEGHVADVVASRLPHTVGHLEQPVNRVEARLTPQPGVDGVRCLFLRTDEVALGDVPDLAGSFLDPPRGVLGHQTAARCGEVGGVVEADHGSRQGAPRRLRGRLRGQGVLVVHRRSDLVRERSLSPGRRPCAGTSLAVATISSRRDARQRRARRRRSGRRGWFGGRRGTAGAHRPEG